MEPIEQELGIIFIHPEGNWNADKEFTRLSLVNNEEKTYLAKTDVPAGVEITNTNYWQQLFIDFNNFGSDETNKGIPDADKDGKTYGRKNGSWVEVEEIIDLGRLNIDKKDTSTFSVFSTYLNKPGKYKFAIEDSYSNGLLEVFVAGYYYNSPICAATLKIIASDEPYSARFFDAASYKIYKYQYGNGN